VENAELHPMTPQVITKE